jgi:hypothetical protein
MMKSIKFLLILTMLGICAVIQAQGLAAALTGNYIKIGKERFVVCDPTYIGASVGVTMPDMDNQTAKVIILE